MKASLHIKLCLVNACLMVLAGCFLAVPTWSQGRKITPEDYYAIRTASDPQLSPDGTKILYVVTKADRKQNRRYSEIWLAYIDGSREPRQLTDTLESSNFPRWLPDGKSLAFLSARATSQDSEKPGQRIFGRQVQMLSLEDGEPRAITSLKNGVDFFEFSPDGGKLLCISRIGPSDSSPENAEKSDTRHYIHPTDKLDGVGFLDDRRQHFSVVDVKSGSAKQITEGDDWNDTDPQWSPDGARILFSSDRTGKFWEDISQYSPAVWVVSADGGTPVKVSGDLAVGGNAQWSPDGRSIAFFAGHFPHDPKKLWMISATGEGKPRQVTGDLDLSARGLEWGDGGNALFWLSEIKGEKQIFRAAIDSGNISQLTSGARFIQGMNIGDRANSIAYTASAFENPSDVYVSKLDGTHEVRLTHLNEDWLKQVIVQPLERMSYPVQEGLTMDGFLVKPVGLREGQKYPLILYIHGGPEGMFGANWMFEVQVLAAKGWGVVYINPRGSTGYGNKFGQAIVKEWGGKAYTDIQAGVDTVIARNPWVDTSKLGIMGGSYGGFMTIWTTTQTNRYKAAVACCAMSDFISVEGTRDDYYGHAHDFDGDLFQNFNLYWKYSPLRYAMNVKTPTLILQGDADQRVPMEQAEQWFRALHHFHVPSELVIFPRESHEGMHYSGTPHHMVEEIQWQTYWFERYLDGTRAALSPDAITREAKASQ